jgi:uncharacterized protein YgiM (DUF1202 family)
MVFPVAAQTGDDDGETVWPPQYATDETLAVVVYPRVNLRSLPSLDGAVADIAIIGDRFPVAAISQDGRWYLVYVNGGQAWISGGSVIVTHPENIGVIDTEPSPEFVDSINRQVAEAQNQLNVRNNLNIRRGPSTRYNVVAQVPYEDRVTILGRNLYGTWMYVRYNNTVGWVSAEFLAYPPDYQLDRVPVIRQKHGRR